MNINELFEKRKLNVQTLENLIGNEPKELTEEEQRTFENIENEIRGIDTKIEEIKNTNTNNTNRNMKKNFSLMQAIEARANGRAIPEDMQEVINFGKEEMRKSGLNFSGEIVLPMEYRADIVAQTDAQGQDLVPENKWALLLPLRDKMVTVKAGANFIGGLTGDVSIPTYAGTTAAWKGEVVAADDGAGATDEVLMSPKRLTTYIDISKMFLTQTSPETEALLKQDILNAIAVKLEQTILGKVSGSTTQPAGLFYGAITTSGSTSFANVIALEAAVETSNALNGNLSYIVHPSLKAKMKQTLTATGSNAPFIYQNDTINGYPAYSTNAVAKQLQAGTDEYGVVFANWGDLVIGQWGGLDLIVDPYTVAINGKVRLVINGYFDAKFRRTASVAVGSGK